MKSEFKKEHIPGARFVDIWEFLAENEKGIRNEIPEEQTLEKALRSLGINNNSTIVICYENADAIPRAARLFYTLDYAGLADQVAMLQGGLQAWKLEQRPLTDEETKIKQGHVDISVNEGVRASREEVISGLQNENVILVDARPSERYYGTETDSNSSRQGHISGAVNLPYFKLTLEDSTHLFKEEGDLRELLSDRNIQEDSRMIVYCGSGIWASSVYFIALHLGYEVQMYDGSIQEWDMDSSLPMSKSSIRSSDF
jgi:thiosulfate/3-mercaptopyruvate sulfurtransferase